VPTKWNSQVPGDAALGLAELAVAPSVERAVDAFRDFLGMEVAFVGQLTAGSEILRNVRGDGDSFGFSDGTRLRRELSYCQRILDGRLPNVIGDVRADARAATLPLTDAADVGSFVSVPIRFADGFLFGMLCAASHDTHADIGYRGHQFLNVFARMTADILEREKLQRLIQHGELQDAAVKVLLAALNTRDAYTSSHSRTVVMHAVAVAERLGLNQDEAEDVRRVAMLHDVGKMAIPDAILHKPTSLNEAEWEVMRTHPTVGEELLSHVPSLRGLTGAVRAEHEHWDGSGYPDGLRGEQIPLASRITLVCDAYHAMTSDRPYRPALTAAAAADEIEAGIGSQFCPSTAAALLSVVRTRPSTAAAHTLTAEGDEDSSYANPLAPAFHRGLCRCQVCGTHTMADIGCRVAGQCSKCGSYNLAEA
jgi:response regulator RpfG family c-di-GMP phosphodiesterase